MRRSQKKSNDNRFQVNDGLGKRLRSHNPDGVFSGVNKKVQTAYERDEEIKKTYRYVMSENYSTIEALIGKGKHS